MAQPYELKSEDCSHTRLGKLSGGDKAGPLAAENVGFPLFGKAESAWQEPLRTLNGVPGVLRHSS